MKIVIDCPTVQIQASFHIIRKPGPIGNQYRFGLVNIGFHSGDRYEHHASLVLRTDGEIGFEIENETELNVGKVNFISETDEEKELLSTQYSAYDSREKETQEWLFFPKRFLLDAVKEKGPWRNFQYERNYESG